MTARFYGTKRLDLLKLVGMLEEEYREKGFLMQHFGKDDTLNIQFRKDEVWRTILGLQEALGIIFERQPEGILLTVGRPEWGERALVGTLGAALAGTLFPPLIALSFTALAGAANEYNTLQQIVFVIDRLACEQDPDVSINSVPPEKEVAVSPC